MYGTKEKLIGSSHSYDADLVSQVKLGNKKAFEHIYKKYHMLLYDFIYARIGSIEGCEEIIQNIFLNVWQKRTQLKPEGNLKAYLYQSARNAISNFIRHEFIRDKKREQNDFLYNSTISPETELLNSEMVAFFKRAINKLPPKRKEIFLYAFDEGLSRQEIADMQNISIKTVEDHLWKAVKFIRHHIAKYRAM